MLLITAVGLTAICALAGFCVAKNAFSFGQRVALIGLVAISPALRGEAAGRNSSRPGENSAPECEILPFWPVACERILASVNNSQSPMRRGASHLKKGMQVDVVGSDAEGTEIVYQRKHVFADDGLF